MDVSHVGHRPGDCKHLSPTREIARMQLVNFGFDYARHQPQVIEGCRVVARRHGVSEIVDELLTIVELAENILSLFQLGNRPGRSKGPGRSSDLEGIAKFFERDTS